MDKFLLMGHQHHPKPFIKDGVNLGDHPHFHKIKYYGSEFAGRHSPRKTHELSSLLFIGMDSEQFLNAFLKEYYFDHTGDGEIRKITEKRFQSKLGDFNRQTENTQ